MSECGNVWKTLAVVREITKRLGMVGIFENDRFLLDKVSLWYSLRLGGGLGNLLKSLGSGRKDLLCLRSWNPAEGHHIGWHFCPLFLC